MQDEGSQLAALLAGAKPGEQVVDLCAGAGGKTLALAAAMENRGQIYATDSDKRRLAPIHARLERAGARNVQVRTPKADRRRARRSRRPHADLVLIDAPCTGTGTWRRNPDAKWRMRPGALDAARARSRRRCSTARRRWSSPAAASPTSPARCWRRRTATRCAPSSARHPDFAIVPPAEVAGALGERAFLFRRAVLMSEEGLLMTPRRTDTDGFFVVCCRRNG